MWSCRTKQCGAALRCLSRDRYLFPRRRYPLESRMGGYEVMVVNSRSSQRKSVEPKSRVLESLSTNLGSWGAATKLCLVCTKAQLSAKRSRRSFAPEKCRVRRAHSFQQRVGLSLLTCAKAPTRAVLQGGRLKRPQRQEAERIKCPDDTAFSLMLWWGRVDRCKTIRTLCGPARKS